MKEIFETQLLINNKLISASDNATFDLFSPYTGEIVAKGTAINLSMSGSPATSESSLTKCHSRRSYAL
jgi:hypothetical protein